MHSPSMTEPPIACALQPAEFRARQAELAALSLPGRPLVFDASEERAGRPTLDPGPAGAYARTVTAPEGHGYDSPEAAARGDIPERFATVVGVRVDGDTAHVWMLTNDRPPFEPYEQVCVRCGGRWHPGVGSGGFSVGVPTEVLEAAARLGLR
jgi:hypothetical protein